MGLPIVLRILMAVGNAVAPAIAKAVKSSPNAKANGAVLGGAAGVGGGAGMYVLLDVALSAFLGGAMPQLETGLATLGGAVTAGIINWIVAYATPKNEDA